MAVYYFALGHQPHISQAEIDAVLTKLGISFRFIHQNAQLLILETTPDLPVEKLASTLGGIVKIGRKILEKNLANFFANSQTEGKIQFSLSGQNADKLGLTIKKELRGRGRSARYIPAKNTATIFHNHLIEKQGDITLTPQGNFVTVAIQPFMEFTERDYGRPESDDYSGMLPPKLARIMINLSQAPDSALIYDPFCGSGTILTEAASLGYKQLLGSDLSPKAIADTKKNLDWLQDRYQLAGIQPRLFVSSVEDINQEIKTSSVPFIITEPFLGKPLTGREKTTEIEQTIAELNDLYYHSFLAFNKIMTKNGLVIFIIPKFKHNNNWLAVDCIEKIKSAGFIHRPFSLEQPCLDYHRPDQHLARTIWKF